MLILWVVQHQTASLSAPRNVTFTVPIIYTLLQFDKKFNFRNKSDKEVEEEAVLQQRNQIKSIEKTLKKRQCQKKDLEEIKQNLQNKKTVYWNDKKKIEEYI